MPANYVLIREVTLNASASSVTINNIPQTGYTDLKLVISSRSTASVGDQMLRFNSNSSSSYSYRLIRAYDGPASNTEGYSGQTYFPRAGYQPKSDYVANVFSNTEIYIPSYLSQDAKSILVDSVATNNTGSALLMQMATGVWNVTGVTSPITSITVDPSVFSGGFASGSTFSLYGVAAVGTTPTVVPKDSGGDIITNDGTYWYHAFLSSGAFIPNTNITVDTLCVAGGAGGGGQYGGGGGAGGYVYLTNQPLTATSATVVVGAGGAGGDKAGGAPNGYNGGNSQVGSLTAAIGGGGGAYASSVAGSNGGSGGGGHPYGGTYGTGTAGQGNRGGTAGATGTWVGAGGGGGAGAVGGNGTGSDGGTGNYGGPGGAGINTYSSLVNMFSVGSSGYICGGGGGGGGVNTAASGGSGGGGVGGMDQGFGAAARGGNGAAYTGGGGGGGGNNGGNQAGGGNGGSGFVIIKYAMA